MLLPREMIDWDDDGVCSVLSEGECPCIYTGNGRLVAKSEGTSMGPIQKQTSKGPALLEFKDSSFLDKTSKFSPTEPTSKIFTFDMAMALLWTSLRR